MRNTLPLAWALLLVLPTVAAVDPPVEPPSKDELLPLVTEQTKPFATATIDAPAAGSEVGGVILVSGTATARDGFTIGRVGVFVDSRLLGYADGIHEWSFRLDTRTFVDGDHALVVRPFAAPSGDVSTAIETPEDVPAVHLPYYVGLGWATMTHFRTLNHEPGVILYERTAHVGPADHDEWAFVLDRDYSGLRVTIDAAPAAGAEPAPRVQVAVAYLEAVEGDDPPRRTWIATYGNIEGSGTVSEPPHGNVEAGGLLTLAGAYAGSGVVTGAGGGGARRAGRVRLPGVPTSWAPGP